jgi:hypothetical protein
MGSAIYQVIKRCHDGHSTIKVNSFRQLLKYQDVVRVLVRLFKAGGIWAFNTESTYALLAKCKIEQVSDLLFCYVAHLTIDYYRPSIALLLLVLIKQKL